MDIKIIQNVNIKENCNQNIFSNQEIRNQLKQYYNDIKELLSQKLNNFQNNKKLCDFKDNAIYLIKTNFQKKYNILPYKDDKPLMEAFIFSLNQEINIEIKKLVQLIDNDNIITFFLSFYNINNIQELTDKKNELDDPFILIEIKIILFLNNISIVKEFLHNIYNKEILPSQGYFFIKIIQIFNNIKYINKEDIEKNFKPNSYQLNDDIKEILKKKYTKIYPILIEYFSDIILEYDIKYTIIYSIQNKKFIFLFEELMKFKHIRNKILNFLCNSSKTINKKQYLILVDNIKKNKILEKIIILISQDILNKRYTSLREVLIELKKFVKLYLVDNLYFEEAEEKLIDIFDNNLENFDENSKNNSSIKSSNTTDKDNLYLKFINDINNFSSEIHDNNKFIIINFLLNLFQSSNVLRNFIYESLLRNLNGDLKKYKEVLSQTKFLNLFVGNLWKCNINVIKYFFEFLHSFNKNVYFPKLEFSKLIDNLTNFSDIGIIMKLVENLKIYQETIINVNKNLSQNSFNERKELIDSINKYLIDTLHNIIKKSSLTVNKTNFKSKLLIPVFDYILLLIIDNNKIYQYFANKDFSSFLHFLLENNEYKIIAYKILEISLKMSGDKEQNEAFIKIILNRFDYILEINNDIDNTKIKTKNIEIEILKELIMMFGLLKIIFQYEIFNINTLNDNSLINITKKNISQRILNCISEYFIYINCKKENILLIYNNDMHKLFKKYLEIILEIFITSNKNCLTKINKISPTLSEEIFSKVIYNTLSFFKYLDINKDKLIDKGAYFFDIILYLINIAMGIEQSKLIKEIEDVDICLYYKNKFSINEKTMNDFSNMISICSNVNIQNPLLLATILKTLVDLNYFLDKYLEYIYFVLKVNRINITLLLRQNILIELLKISCINTSNNEVLLKIFDIIFIFMQKKDLVTIFEHLIKTFNNGNQNLNKEIIQCLNNCFNKYSDKNYLKGIYLSNYEIKQPNIYNLININDINLENSDESCMIIRQDIIFYLSIEKYKLILFKLEKNINNNIKEFLEVSLDNGKLTVTENDPESVNNKNLTDDLQINAQQFIRLNQLNKFKYTFNYIDNKLTVNINGKNIFGYEFHSIIPQKKKITDKNKTTSFIFNNNTFITIGFPLELVKSTNKNDNKLILYPHIKLMSFSINNENNQNKNSGIDEIHKTIYELNINNILIDKDNTKYFHTFQNFKLDEKTKLISKYNLYNTIIHSHIFEKSNNKSKLYRYILYIDKYLKYSLDINFRLEKYIFILLNFNFSDKALFKVLIDLLTLYAINNSEYMLSFMEREELSSTLYFVLYKNASLIDESIIEMLFSGLFNYDNSKENIVTNILLDYQLFEKLTQNTKIKILSLLNKKLLIGKNTLKYLLINKLSQILLLCNNTITNNENIIDEMIIEILFKILKNAMSSKAIKLIEELLYIFFKYNSLFPEHIENKTRKTETNSILSDIFSKLNNNDFIIKEKDIFIKYIQETDTLDSNYKNQFTNICLSFKPSEQFITLDQIELDLRNKRKLSNPLNDTDRLVNFKKKFSHDVKYNAEQEIDNENDNGLSYKNNKYKLNEYEKTVNSKIPKLINNVISGFKFKSAKKDLAEMNKIELIERKKSLQIKNNNSKDVYFSELRKDSKTSHGDNCILCKFIKKFMDDLFCRELKFLTYKKYILHIFAETYIFNKNLDYKIQFSYYLKKSEGVSRVRNKFELKTDEITNSEININEIQKIPGNEIKNIFNFYKNKNKLISKNLMIFCSLEQIFDINFIPECIDKNDKYISSYNCLLFKGLNYVNCVLVIGELKIYILENMILSNEMTLNFVETPIKKSFWVVENFSEILNDNCHYLNTYDLFNNIKKNKIILKKNIENNSFNYISFSYNQINELHKKKFVHQNNALEIFLKDGKNYYIAFNKNNRDIIINLLLTNISNNNNSNNEIININNQSLIKSDSMIFMREANIFIEKLTKYSPFTKTKKHHSNKIKTNLLNFSKITDIKEILEQSLEKWSSGYLDTYSYIMILNTLSGRTYNDLAQYPIFPWILKDYTSNELDLNESDSYRDLNFPIYAQEEEYRKNLKKRYDSIEDSEIKYHSGSHYSNPAFVCYYLVRIKPFSIYASEIQGNCFDQPDRLFHNIKNFYKVQGKFQELIPEFFNIPEIYVNINNYNFGKNLENIKVNDVILPLWASNSPRLFSKMNKKALESQYVSQQIHNWIDLIFGYKQKGSEAEKSYNVLREVCSSFNPKNYNDNEEIENKINEMCEMGINPIQLFFKQHPKREKHLLTKAFFGRSAYLTYFKPKINKYQIKNINNSSINEIYKYYENSERLSVGEGGLSSFRTYYDKNSNHLNKNKENEKNDTYFIVGKNKTLLPPSYKNYIEWGNDNTFNLVKPFTNILYIFKLIHMKDHKINCIKVTKNGKYIIIGYENGVIEKYLLIYNKKQNKSKKSTNNIINPIIKEETNPYTKTKSSNSIDNNDKDKSQDLNRKGIINNLFDDINKRKLSDEKANENLNVDVKKSADITRDNERKMTDKLSSKKMKKYSTSTKLVKFNNLINNNNIAISDINTINSDCLLINEKFNKQIKYDCAISYINTKNINQNLFSVLNTPGYFIHTIKDSNDMKNYISKKNIDLSVSTIQNYSILLVNSSSRILNEISFIDICLPFTFMLVVDKLNKIYLYDFTTFNILKYIDFCEIYNNKIKFSSICPYTGEFVLSSSKMVTLFNINGVILSEMKDVKSKIKCCFITLIPMAKSGLFLFTGHEDGDLLISKIIVNINKNIDIENNLNQKIYQDAYNSKDNKICKRYLDNKNLPLIFDTLIKINCSVDPIKYIKLTEDLTEMICVDDKNKLIYLSYEEFFENKIKNSSKNTSKKCPMCQSHISSSKISCHLCGKKLCANCKIEKIIAEFSLKNKTAICEDCVQLIKSTSKMLYDL